MSPNKFSSVEVAERALQEGKGLSTAQVAALTGLTYRQLDYWRRTDLIRPSVRRAHGSGTQDVWSAGDVLMLRRIRQLLDIGVSLQRVRHALPFIRDPEGCRWLYVRPDTVGVTSELEQACAGASTIVIDLGEEVVQAPHTT